MECLKLGERQCLKGLEAAACPSKRECSGGLCSPVRLAASRSPYAGDCPYIKPGQTASSSITLSLTTTTTTRCYISCSSRGQCSGALVGASRRDQTALQRKPAALTASPSLSGLKALCPTSPRGSAANALRDAAESLPQLVLSHGVETQDIVATGAAFLLALFWVRLWDELVARRLVDSKLSRKLVHITTGLLFMLCWPLFSNHVEARFFAAAVPAANILRLGLLGLGITKNEAVVKAVSREGNPRELLRGPLFYVITTALVTILFWRTSPVGSIALAMMCGGDGIADIVGRRWGSSKLPWNRNKSWAGSVAMFFFGAALSIMFIYIFRFLGYYPCTWWSFLTCLQIAGISLGATIVESLPISSQLDDNFTVPATAIVLALLFLPSP